MMIIKQMDFMKYSVIVTIHVRMHTTDVNGKYVTVNQ